MAHLSWLTLKGELQGDISARCGSRNSIGNKSQTRHLDQILIYGLDHETTRQQNVCHHELRIVKPVDRASPLLNKAINDNESLDCIIDLYRVSPGGQLEVYYKIKLYKAHISHINIIVPHNIIESGNEAQERVSFIYESISWEHCMASTSAFSLWSDRRI
ncbi:Hcp family type VI secretion system effector [Citrobacter rodentium]|jgi:type VI secretion system effector, Hcp1 family|uniref:Hcp family T6SS protein CtsH4 n=2 Tax=Citrobacter rodentium TaxID=67825 RepID=D2TLM0_CITRI|nr:Hcp family type VI secretion system effector [Citrobacter rodentium]KIQ52070.1 Hcp [Citrobacter rodentium]QBY30674.1 Hcp family type VI secretion system effector [Citrobacter rodentium]UHO31956.1 Hcp family type VI secretion system effector [Citrobacter rodentium NBRC 105723 = DSM 16636]CBG91100.1 Hcp family T6SS protein CtsH4 [Citrobacter rodentium ICC168]HAT8011273.1 type VI secretion system tube protein Hcp [Citrobacter rodentium NBRC 105723 = DSM 16636]